MLLSVSCALVQICLIDNQTAETLKIPCSCSLSAVAACGANRGCSDAGNGVSQEQIRLIDDQTFETLDLLPLHRYEMACSCTSITLADDPNFYYVVGTAYAIPEEQEPTKVMLSSKLSRDNC